MSRYIEADAIKEALKQNLPKYVWSVMLSTINVQPHIDIVRCKECKWAEPNREGDYDCKCHIPIFRVIADDFCSYGEKKGADDETN